MYVGDGIAILKDFYKKNPAWNFNPVELESFFQIILEDKEHDENHILTGKIDRVDSNGGSIHVIDYKTGAKALTRKQADKDLQLSIYGLAATLIPEQPFNRKPDKVKLSLMYFDTPQVVTTERTKLITWFLLTAEKKDPMARNPPAMNKLPM